jgi:hypothetical protein
MRHSPPVENLREEDERAAKKGSRKAGGRRKAAKVQDLTDRSGRSASGGEKGEAYTLQTMSSAIGDVVKTFGEALNTAARKG